MQALENLARIGRLESCDVDRGEVRMLLAAARQSLADAACQAISPPTRFDAAYEAILQGALAALLANGYRTSSSRGGHHSIAIQSLGHTLKMDRYRLGELDGLRRRRNANDYYGTPISAAEADECRAAAAWLLRAVEVSLKPVPLKPQASAKRA